MTGGSHSSMSARTQGRSASRPAALLERGRQGRDRDEPADAIPDLADEGTEEQWVERLPGGSRWPRSAGGSKMTVTMRAMKAHVSGGRLVLDEPTDLPEGTEVELTLVEDDDFSPEERARLEQALEEAEQQIERGEYVDGSEFIARLRARREA